MTEAKAEARTRAYAARAAARVAEGGESSAATARLLAALGPDPGPVAGYIPIRTEIDPLPAMAALVARGVPVGVPVIVGKGQPLVFRAWTPDAVLVPGPFGVSIPEDGVPVTPRTLICPLLAFDAGLVRLGYGGGFYDRTLSALRAAGPVRAVGFAFDGQEVERLPSGPFDMRLDAVATPTRTLEPLRPGG